MPAEVPPDYDDHDGGPARRSAPGSRHRHRCRAAPTTRHHDRGRAHRLAAPDALHHAGRLSLSRARALGAQPSTRRGSLHAFRGGARMRPRLGPVLVVALVASMAACSEGKVESKTPPRRAAIPVAVAAVEQKPVPLLVQAIGSVEAYSVVSVRAQVGGELMRVHIKEGQDVKKGDLLFTIDPRPFQAALAQAQATMAQHQAQVLQAEANMARDHAQLENARVEEARYKKLVAGGFVAREQYDQFLTALKTSEEIGRAHV